MTGERDQRGEIMIGRYRGKREHIEGRDPERGGGEKGEMCTAK